MLGRNQIIGVGLTAAPVALGFVLVILGKLDAGRWIEMSQTLASVGVGGTLGGSAVIKAVKAWRGYE